MDPSLTACLAGPKVWTFSVKIGEHSPQWFKDTFLSEAPVKFLSL